MVSNPCVQRENSPYECNVLPPPPEKACAKAVGKCSLFRQYCNGLEDLTENATPYREAVYSPVLPLLPDPVPSEVQALPAKSM